MNTERFRDLTRPCLQWLDATHLTVSAHLPDLQGFPLDSPNNLAHYEMRNGQRYDSVLLTLDASVTGENGFDVAPLATAFYYVYIVPSTAAPGQLALVASLHDPLDGGPATPEGTTYPTWIYAGSARWDNGTGAFTAFRYDGEGQFNFIEPIQVVNEAAADDAAAVAVDLLGGAVEGLPQYTYSATIIFRSILTLGAASGIRYHLWAATDAGITAPTWSELVCFVEATDAAEVCAWATVPAIPTGASPYLWYQREDIAAGSTATFDVFIAGYKDACLA